jgi:CheY-like chemotaxis protein
MDQACAEQSQRQQTVLIVEDDLDVQDAVKGTLEDSGYGVVCAGHGEEALQYLRAHGAPALILLDLFMPVMNGWELARCLRQDAGWREIPVVLLTALQRHWGYPVSRVLRKPITSNQLLQAIRAALNARRGGREPLTPPPVPVASAQSTSDEPPT